MNRVTYSLYLIIFLLVAFPLSAHAEKIVVADGVSIENYLSERSKPNVVVIDAYEIEPLFHVGGMSSKHDGMTSQTELDAVLQQMIPDKSSKVILYCRDTFMPSRVIPAAQTVAMSLKGMGYNNVSTMGPVWGTKPIDVRGKKLSAEEFAQYEVYPYKKALPENAKKILARYDALNNSEPKGTK